MKKIFLSLLRHGATAIGGAAIATGDQNSQLAGAAVAAIGAVSSLIKAYRESQVKK